MKAFLKILTLAILFVSCSSNNEGINSNSLTESFLLKGVQYGSESRQFLDIYKAESDCSTPVYFDAHGNGGNTYMPNSIIEDLNAQGVSVIAWESLTSVNTPSEVETGWNDAELMFEWVINNAEEFNLDTSNFIIGGSSRGSIISWKYGHQESPNIKGFYFYNALPDGTWTDPNWWSPTDEVNISSAPIYFVYGREPGSSENPINPDAHDPENGIIIINKYQALGIGDRTALVHSIGDSNNTDKYQFLVDFALSVISSCP
ncbi:alpha/beta hydrolase [Psychroserpens burtonensis]|uniref:Alpha/beta hydrolase n=1 Tax=Psychroserpens burtonensis TaxID=49278 RepID=A0A5C7B4H5_9FLAO|nr:alpha/beta hydrolase [Psychroserpens burtonensis]TXE16412.1 alpha/beta hydrolase [Psychroserpens burtonensis]